MDNYNGWTNYATWRVNLELFDGMGRDYVAADPDADVADVADVADLLRSIAEEAVDATTQEGIGRDYAFAFISDVNFEEIARHMIDEFA